MKVTLNQLKLLFASYGLKVIQARKIDDGYVVQTNEGKKLVTIWENFDLLRWSNTWRETLHHDIEQPTQRFLANHNEKKFIHFDGRYFVVCELPEGREVDPSNAEECKLGGEIFAKFHTALDRIDQKANAPTEFELNEDFFTKGSTVIKNVVKAIEQKPSPSLTDDLIYANLPLLYQRFRRAHQLWEGVQEHTAYFPLSFSRCHLNQITLEENGWTFHGNLVPSLAVMHKDTASLIREIYQKSEWNLSSVIAFLEGYHSQRKWTEHELIFILAQFAIPWDVWSHFENYLKHENLGAAETERMVEDIHRQRDWDELTSFIGSYIDKQKGVSA